VILVYHRIVSRASGAHVDWRTLEEQLLFLRRHFEIVPPALLRDKRKALDKLRVVLTFDDGFRNQTEVAAPILRRHHLPAIFFISSRHSTPRKYLWFAYLEALEKHFKGNGFCFGGEFMDMSPEKRHITIARLRETLLNLKPHPAAMYELMEQDLPCLEDFVCASDLLDYCAGMTEEQVGELASDPLFSVGVHTVDHPFLTKCTPDEAQSQILDNKRWLEGVSGQPCNTIAYPAGDYDAEILKQCRQCGLNEGHALIPMVERNSEQELPRIGVYSASLELLGFKVQWGNHVRSIQAMLA